MHHVLHILTSRRASIALMAFVAVFGALGGWIPQSSPNNAGALAAWQDKNPLLARIADALGLHAIFSSWWFLTVLGAFAVVLAVATVRMVRDAGRAWRSPGGSPRTVLPGVRVESLLERARALGYRERHMSGGRLVLTRRRVGIWAPAILHAGMLLSLVWAALLLGATHGAIADFSQGEVREPGDAYAGIVDAGTPPEVGVAWRFDGMHVETWPGGGLKELSASLSFLSDDGTWEQRTCAVNRPLRINGHTIYVQPAEFGDAALLRFFDGAGAEQRIRMEFDFVPTGEVAYTGTPYTVGERAIEGRWDPFGLRDDKPLGLRPADDTRAEPVTLAPGETVRVADMTVEFVGTVQWARLIVQRSPSVLPLFCGFFVIGIGSVLLYVAIPRELVLETAEEGVRYSWHAARMPRVYLAELQAILRPEETSGSDA